MRKNCSSDQEKLLKFESEGREFAKFLRSLKLIYLNAVVRDFHRQRKATQESVIEVVDTLNSDYILCKPGTSGINIMKSLLETILKSDLKFL